MNERIKELAEQAGLKFSKDWGECYTGNVQIERFAELVRQNEREQWDTSDMAYRAGGLSVEQEPEPTAWVTDDFAITYRAEVAQRWRDKEWKVVPFYTAPPKREWVGLTDEERCTFASWLNYKTVNEIFDAIEAKLKERNNG
jgi:hypothetical protein